MDRMYVHSVLPNDWSTRSGLQVHYLAHGHIAPGTEVKNPDAMITALTEVLSTASMDSMLAASLGFSKPMVALNSSIACVTDYVMVLESLCNLDNALSV